MSNILGDYYFSKTVSFHPFRFYSSEALGEAEKSKLFINRTMEFSRKYADTGEPENILGVLSFENVLFLLLFLGCSCIYTEFCTSCLHGRFTCEKRFRFFYQVLHFW